MRDLGLTMSTLATDIAHPPYYVPHFDTNLRVSYDFITLKTLTLARFPYFATFASGGRGVGAPLPPPWRLETKRHRA